MARVVHFEIQAEQPERAIAFTLPGMSADSSTCERSSIASGSASA